MLINEIIVIKSNYKTIIEEERKFFMKGKTKKSIIVLVVLLAIGFAAVSTTLYINGVIHLGANETDFQNNLVFTRASLDYSDDAKTDIQNVTGAGAEGDKLRILDNGKSISFTTETLKSIGESVTLSYDITNNSQYGAEFTGITCDVYNGTEISEANKNANPDYITLEVKDFKNALAEGATEATNKRIAPTEKIENQTVKVTMKKSFVGTDTETTKTYTIKCTINASGTSE